MAFDRLLQEDRFAALSESVFRRYGIELETGTDFEEYREILAYGRPNHTLGAPFDPMLHQLGGKQALWIVGRDENGEIMHTQALRLIALGDECLGGFLRRAFHEFPPSGLNIDLERSKYRAGPGAKRITGNVVYHGEVWLGGTSGEFRATGLSGILGRFAFLTAIRTWAPDFVFGFIPKTVAHKGFVERQGYMHAEPYALRWYQYGKPDPFEGLLVYMSLEDMRFVIDMPESEPIMLVA